MQSNEVLQRQLKELAVLHALALAATEAQSEEALLMRATELIYQTLEPAVIGTALVDEAQGVIRLHATSHALQGAPQTLALPLGQGIVGQVIADGLPRRIADVTHEPHYFEWLVSSRSELCVPLKIGARVIGALNVESQTVNAFTADDERLFVTFANQLATAIEKVRLLAAERQRMAEREALHATLTDLASEFELPKLLQTILARAAQLLSTPFAELGLYDEAQQVIQLVATHNFPAPFDHLRLRVGEGALGRVALTREPLIVDDYYRWEGRSAQYPPKHPDAFYTLIAAPLLVNERLLGVMSVGDDRRPRQFTPSELRLLTLFAQEATLAIEKARAYETALTAAERRAVLYRATQEISTSLDAEQVFAAIHRAVAQLMPSEIFVITLLDEQRRAIVGAYLIDKGTRLPTFTAPLGSGLSGYVMTTGQTLRVDEFTAEVEAQTGAKILGPDPYRPRSILAVPLRLKDQTIGALSTQSHRPHAYTTDDQELLEQLATHAAITLENAKLFATERRRVKELEALHATTADISAEMDLNKLLQIILSRATTLLDATSGTLALYEEASQRLRIVATYNLPSDYTNVMLSLDEGIMGKVAVSHQPLVVDDYAQWEGRSSQFPFYPNESSYAITAAPLLRGEQLIGVMNISDYRLPRRFDANNVRLLMLFAQQAAVAIEKARAHAATTKAAERHAILYQASQALNTSLDLEQVYAAIYAAAMRLMSCDAFVLALLASDGHTLHNIYAFENGRRTENFQYPTQSSLSGRVIATGQSLKIDQLDATTKQQALIFGDERLQSVIFVPLQVKGQTIGILSAQSRLPYVYTQDDQAILEELAAHASVAIDNARLFAAERRRAEELEALRQTIADISVNLELATLLEAILKRAQTLLTGDGGALALYRAEINELEIVAGPQKEIGIRLALGEGALGQVAQTRQPLIIDDYAQWAHHLPFYTSGAWHAVVGAPLILSHQLIGAITVSTTDSARRFIHADMQLLHLFAQQAAIAVENARLFGEVQRLAIIDPLTGQYNRRHFFEKAEHELIRAQRYARPLSAIMLDIDHFKRINDTYGHSVGDQVLRAVAQHCRQALRAIDLLGRYGGEEFSILLPDTSLADARLVAERLCQQLPLTPIEIAEDVITVTVSQGVATLNGSSSNIDQLLDHADQALLEAKRAGRNRVVAWNAALTETSPER
jgi:diguanylate cyclase (GGDEF)-like protein